MSRACALGVVIACVVATDARAFVHVVQPGESLSGIANRVYGTSKMETVLAGANALDVQGGSAVVPGMRLEVPAPWHHRIEAGETWPRLARAYLGDADRADALARMNGASAWIAPAVGTEIRIPFVLTVIASGGDKTTDLATRYLGDRERAWEIHSYNGLTKTELVRGQVVLIPLVNLALTDIGKEEAARAAGLERSQSAGAVLDTQKKVSAELPELLADVRTGRWVEAVARGSRMLGTPDLSRAQLATIHRALVTTYVALDAKNLAATACAAWKTNDAGAFDLDPVMVSPKIRAACK
jgi:LysM repeat protein